MHEQRTCLACGQPFTPTHPLQNTCPPTDEQRAKAKGQPRSRCAQLLMRNRARGIPDDTPAKGSICLPYDCAQCGKHCTPGVDVVPHASRFCGVPCKKEWHRVHTTGPKRKRAARRVKAERAIAKAAAGSTTDALWIEGPCVTCGLRFLSRASLRRVGYCSRDCARPELRKRRRAKYGHERHEQRARRFGVASEPISPRKVFRRDGYRCRICLKMTKRNAKVPDLRAPTVDHIVPLSKGGGHLYVNVQCACFECNWRKGDGAANDQLLLVG